MPAEAPYTEVLDSVAANSPEAPSSLSSADVSLPHSTISSTSSSGEKPSSFSPSSVPHNLRPNTLNATKDMYWFAHTGESSHQESRTDGEGSPVRSPRNGEQQAPTGSEAGAGAGDAAAAAAAAAGVSSPDSAKTTPVGRGALSPGHSESKEDNSPQALRDRELRLRHYKELQEEDRLRRLNELQSASILAQRFREQQEEERKRKIEELRSRDVERRQAVEERKRLIWEAEQERKEAILRRNLDREAKIEARRNAHRNSMSFAFGSSTPRELDLPLGASPTAGMTASRGVTFGSMMAFPTGNHPSDLYKKRTPSADVLDKKSDPMTRSLVILPSNRGRRKTDLTPTIPWERESALRSHSPGTIAGIAGGGPQAKRAVSMSRLDILAQPRRRPSANMDPSAPGAAMMATSMTSKGLLKDSQSPSRPRSSQSMASELSVASTVSMRSQSGPRRPRPISIAGSIVPANVEQGQVMHPLPPQRRSRTSERKVPIPPPTRPPRAKSVGNDVLVPAAPAGSPKAPASAASRKPPVAPKPGPMIKPEAAPLPQMAKEVEPPILAAPTTIPPELEVPKEPEKMEETSPEPPLLPELSALIPEPSLISEPQQKVEEQQPPPEEQQPQQELPPPPPQQATVVPVSTNSEDKEGSQPVGKAPRITSEEEAKAALAEKRRLAREQAEREAELERQRQEELRRQEEERIRLEEEEQQRFEEEQLRLIQELRLQEEEKLRKAIEEQQKKEEEEKVRKEEEVKLRAEKEEQDRKLKEDTERQKKEMEEKLKREEADRAERKKRVEQIMKRTRTKNEGTPQKADDAQKPVEGGTVEPEPNKVPLLLDVSQETNDLVSTDTDSRTVDDLLPESDKLPNNIVPQEESQEDDKTSETVKKVNGVENILDSEVMVVTASTELLAMQNGFQGDFVITQNGVSGKAKAPSNSEDVSPQTNGYSSHDVSFSEISPDEKTQPDLGPLLDFDSIGSGSSIVVQVQRGLSPPPPPTDFDQLIDLSLGSANQNEMNRLNNSDELNSNRVPASPFTAFEESVTRKQESTITDLLT